MTDLDKFINRYVVFEDTVRRKISEICATQCRICSLLCCKPEFCRETFESPFLSMIHKEFCPPDTYTEETGWLSETGCILKMGRPPVCYEFFCKSLISSQPSDLHRYMLGVLGKLVPHMGKRALGPRHLTEIMKPDDLHRINFPRCQRQMTEAQAGFETLLSFYRYGNVEKEAFQELAKILPFPE